MCNTPILVYQCGHNEPTRRVASCQGAIYNGTECKRPQPKRYPEHGDCTNCTIGSEAARLERSIQQTRQSCLRLGATPKAMADIEPTREQMRTWRFGKFEGPPVYDNDSGYGSESTWSGSQYSKSRSGTSSEYSASPSTTQRSRPRRERQDIGRHLGYTGGSGLRGKSGSEGRFDGRGYSDYGSESGCSTGRSHSSRHRH